MRTFIPQLLAITSVSFVAVAPARAEDPAPVVSGAASGAETEHGLPSVVLGLHVGGLFGQMIGQPRQQPGVRTSASVLRVVGSSESRASEEASNALHLRLDTEEV